MAIFSEGPALFLKDPRIPERMDAGHMHDFKTPPMRGSLRIDRFQFHPRNLVQGPGLFFWEIGLQPDRQFRAGCDLQYSLIRQGADR